jgi:hypothetical protein
MPGGQFDSSKTRVAPVFDQLRQRPDRWVQHLLALAEHGEQTTFARLDLTVLHGYWGDSELGLDPPVSLLSWLIRNPTPALHAQSLSAERTLLAQGDSTTVREALSLLRTAGGRPGWHILEGPTYPDVLLETPDALVVIEGKRTERDPTTRTTFMEGRHQIWRHLDAAWEIRGRRRVFGLFIVEGTSGAGDVPISWIQAADDARSEAALSASFPHRSLDERASIAQCLVGVTTWQRVCTEFGIAFSGLPNTVGA